MLLKLISYILDQGIPIKVETSLGSNNDESGAYDPDNNGTGPTIFILRASSSGYWISKSSNERANALRFVHESMDANGDLFILAHELGHHRSAVTGLRTPDYETALALFNSSRAHELDISQRHLILNEEEHAWRLSEEILTEIGFVERAALKMKRDAAINIYRKKLRL